VAPGGPANAKSAALRRTVRTEFEKSRGETDPAEIERLKSNAVRALSNYLLATSARNDPKVGAAMKTFHDKSVRHAKDARQQQQKQRQSEKEES